jgi:hypothetical protein
MSIYPIKKKNIDYLSLNFSKKFKFLVLAELFDNLKLLGFYFATSAAISVSINQLKTPLDKNIDFLKVYKFFSKNIKDWETGKISEYNKYKFTLEQWNFATELLKDKLVQNYLYNEPTNSIFMMSFSGARGNLSQVKQLIGARGLMADQSGNLIELPILSNFKEGLTTTDYIISSYGARKGIIDTALKTASAGYLTRRLIFLVESIIIKDFDCRDIYGINIFQKNKLFFYSLEKPLIKIKTKKEFKIAKKMLLFRKQYIFKGLNKIFCSLISKNLKNISAIQARSILSCKQYPSSCQKCYGIDYAKNALISLGEAAGVIAAQSIGEPGTQLTMRTFHTGGAISTETNGLLYSKNSGFFIFPESFKKSLICIKRDNGYIGYLINDNITAFFKNWKYNKIKIKLLKNCLLYSIALRFYLKNETFGEQHFQSFSSLNFGEFINKKKNAYFYPFYSTIDSILIPKNLAISNYYILKRPKKKLAINKAFFYSFSIQNSVFDKIVAKEIINQTGVKIKNIIKINKKTVATTFLVSSVSGLVLVKDCVIYLINTEKMFKLNFLSIKNLDFHFIYNIYLLTKNFQYLDKNCLFFVLTALHSNKKILAHFKLLK